MFDLKVVSQDIINTSLAAVMPEVLLAKKLNEVDLGDQVYLLAIGKAAWHMSSVALNFYGDKIKAGLVVTKKQHSMGELKNCEIIEAGHPIPDDNSVIAAKKAIKMLQKLTSDQRLLLLISGGGSALFEQPIDGITLEDIAFLNKQLLNSGVSIIEINAIRKQLSQVKGGRLIQFCSNTPIECFIISDVIGDRLDSIASGLSFADQTTPFQVDEIIKKYKLKLPQILLNALHKDSPKPINNCNNHIIGNVLTLCQAASEAAEKLGFKSKIISCNINGEAANIGQCIAKTALDFRQQALSKHNKIIPTALIFGGETTVTIKGDGMGGRNQEVALAASIELKNQEHIHIFSIGSDGSDNLDNIAGAWVDGSSWQKMLDKGIDPQKYLANNDSYHALNSINNLIHSQATGTNVNDLMVALIQ